MAKNCFENIPHESLDFCPNEEIAGGISTRVFYIPTEFLTKLEAPAATGDYEARITIPNTNLTIANGKGWKGVDVLVDEGELKSTLVGNRGNKKSKGEAEMFIPGFRPKVIGFLDTYKNVPMVWAFPDANGVFWLLGTKLNPAYIESAEGTTGKKYEDNSGVPVKLSANSRLYRFTGEIAETVADSGQ